MGKSPSSNKAKNEQKKTVACRRQSSAIERGKSVPRAKKRQRRERIHKRNVCHINWNAALPAELSDVPEKAKEDGRV